MKNILPFLFVVLLAVSCNYRSGSGNVVSQTRNIGSFTGVDAGGGFEVEIKTGDVTKVVVEADDNVIEDVETTVNDGQLKISMRNEMNYNNVHMKVFITSPSINKIRSSASADIDVMNELVSKDKIVMNASSGSSINAAINSPYAEADASSGAEIDITGRTKNLSVEASSGASVDAFNLLSENTTAQTSSGASVDVHASVKLNAKASSGGSISYKGPATVVSNENSGGSIVKKD